MRVRSRGKGPEYQTFKVANDLDRTFVKGGVGPGYFHYTAFETRPRTYGFLGGVIRDGTDITYTRKGDIYYPTVLLTSNVKSLVMRAVLEELSAAVTYRNVSALVSNETEVMTDTVTPDFRKRVNAGEIIINPMEIVYDYMMSFPKGFLKNTYTVTPDGSSNWGTDPSYRYWHFRCYVQVRGGLAQHTSVAVPAAKSRDTTEELDAIANVYDKLQSAELDVALMAAEGSETLSYIRTLCRRIMRLIELATNRRTLAQVATKTWRRLRNLNKNYAWEAKGIAEAWLEVRYAIRPLMYDIAEAMEYFEKGNKRTGKRTTFRSKVQTSNTSEYLDTSSGVTVRYSIDTITTARAGCIAERRLTSQLADLGFLNLAGVVWEKIKWSFILDWIINISGLLYTLNPKGTWSPLGAWVKVTQDVSFTGSVTYDSLDGTSISVPIVGRRRSTHRTAVSGPPLTFISVNLDTFKMLDLAALARSLKGNVTHLRL